MRESLVTKFRHWRYEKEMRVFVKLDPKAEIDGLYFADFTDQLSLAEVIVGARSLVNRSDLADALERDDVGVNRWGIHKAVEV